MEEDQPNLPIQQTSPAESHQIVAVPHQETAHQEIVNQEHEPPPPQPQPRARTAPPVQKEGPISNVGLLLGGAGVLGVAAIAGITTIAYVMKGKGKKKAPEKKQAVLGSAGKPTKRSAAPHSKAASAARAMSRSTSRAASTHQKQQEHEAQAKAGSGVSEAAARAADVQARLDAASRERVRIEQQERNAAAAAREQQAKEQAAAAAAAREQQAKEQAAAAAAAREQRAKEQAAAAAAKVQQAQAAKATEMRVTADAKAAQEKTATDAKAAQDKAAKEKAAKEKAAADSMAAQEVAAQEKALQEEVAQEKAAQEKAAQEKTIAAAKAAQEKATQEAKTAADTKAAQEKAAQEAKAAADAEAAQRKAAQEKAAQEAKAAETRAAEAEVVQEKAAAEEKAAAAARAAAEAKAAQEKAAADAKTAQEKAAQEARAAAEAKAAQEKAAQGAKAAAEAEAAEKKAAADATAAQEKAAREKAAQDAKVLAEAKAAQEEAAQEVKAVADAKAAQEKAAQEAKAEQEAQQPQLGQENTSKLEEAAQSQARDPPEAAAQQSGALTNTMEASFSAHNGHSNVTSSSSGASEAPPSGARPLRAFGSIHTLPPASTGGVVPSAADTTPLTPEEEDAERKLLLGMQSWSAPPKRPVALSLVQQAVASLQGISARPKLVSEANAALADMYFSLQRVPEAEGAVRAAVIAAKEAEMFDFAIKLSNNLGAVMKQQGKLPEVLSLHEQSWDLALDHLGLDHPYTQLARANLVEILDAMGERPRARQFLAEHVQFLRETVEFRSEFLRSEGGDPNVPQKPNPTQLAQAAAAKAARSGSSIEAKAAAAAAAVQAGAAAGQAPPPEQPAVLALRLSRSTLIRAVMEQGKLESKAENLNAAEGYYREALRLCEVQYGKGAVETGSPIYALGACHRQAGRHDQAVAQFTDLYELILDTQGANTENAVGVSRQLYELHDLLGNFDEAAKYAEAALRSMQGVSGTKVHPFLEPFFTIAQSAKLKANDDVGAAELKRQYLKGMAQFSTMNQRNAGRGGHLPRSSSGKRSKK